MTNRYRAALDLFMSGEGADDEIADFEDTLLLAARAAAMDV